MILGRLAEEVTKKSYTTECHGMKIRWDSEFAKAWEYYQLLKDSGQQHVRNYGSDGIELGDDQVRIQHHQEASRHHKGQPNHMCADRIE